MRSTPPELARSALDSAPDAMIITDGSGRICYANHQASALFGYTHDELIGLDVERLMPERFRDRHVAHREGYSRNVRPRAMGEGLELFARRRDGTQFPVEISLSPIHEGGGILVGAAIRDVTERKRAEAELIAARQAAEHAREIADRARSLADQARVLADRANQGKSRFLTTASHDLRQPLQTLALLNGTLRRLITEPQAADVLEHQELAICTMSRLLNALLDISKLESGAIRPEPTDFTVASLFEPLRSEFAGTAAKKGLELHVVSSGERVHSDPSLLEQILRNLLSNAIKYTRAGRVSLQCRPEDPSCVRVDVIDTGIGIPADQIALIFDEFYQVGVPTNSSRDGYGLGLSIVQRLIDLLQLRFEVRSEVGKGSTFSLWLAAAAAGEHAAPAASSAPPPAQQPRPGKAKVLLVEDDPAVRTATRMLLKVEGFDVSAVASLQEAIGKLAAEPDVNLLVTDYHLSGGETGTQVIRAVREALGTPVKAVLITGDTSAAIRNLPLDPHMRLASKPVNADELLTLIRSLLAG